MHTPVKDSTAPRRKVCHIAATIEGATWMLEQLRDLRNEYGYEVSAIVGTGSGRLVDKLQQENIPVHQFDFSFISSPLRAHSLVARVIELARLMRRERFDVVQTHLFDSMVMGRLAGWLADVPVRLAMIAGPYHLEVYTPKWIDLTTCWMETSIIPSCEYTRRLYRQAGVTENRLHVVYYGPDKHKFDPVCTESAHLREEYQLSPDCPLIGMISYFYPPLPASRWTPPPLHDRANKRHEDLVAAAPRILQEFPEARIVFVGSGWGEAGEQHRQNVRQQVRDAGLENRVFFTGFRTDVNSILVDLDVAVQASISENLGGTIESLLMEVPTVATCVGGMVDSVRDQETGVLVEPLNPAALAEGVLTLLRDPVRAGSCARAGRELMLKHFTLDHTVRGLDSVYRQWLERRRGYRIWKTAVRSVQALVIFPYLAQRLTWDLTKAQRDLRIDRLKAHRDALVRQCDRGAFQRFGRWLFTRPLHFYGYLRHLLRGTGALRHWDVFFARIRGRETPEEHPVQGALPQQRNRGAFQRFGRWLYARPLHIYGYLRHLLRGTGALRRWDIFFARIRGRQTHEKRPPRDT